MGKEGVWIEEVVDPCLLTPLKASGVVKLHPAVAHGTSHPVHVCCFYMCSFVLPRSILS